MILKCNKTGSNKSISLNSEYELIQENENRYSLINDNGIQKNYAKNLFEIIPEIPPVLIINELNITTEFSFRNGKFNFKIFCPIVENDNLAFNYTSPPVLKTERLLASCGIHSLDGLDITSVYLENFKRDFEIYLDNNADNFVLNENIDLQEIYSEIYVSLIQDLISMFEGEGNPKAGMIILSTTSRFIDTHPQMLAALNRCSTFFREIHNPNSHNNIMYWTFVIEEPRLEALVNNVDEGEIGVDLDQAEGQAEDEAIF